MIKMSKTPKVKMSAKAIPPSYKPKDRYLGFELIGVEGGLTEKDVEFAFNGVLLGFLGQKGFAEASPRLVSFAGSRGILKCNLESAASVRAALLFLNEVKGLKCLCSVSRMSGTIQSLRE